MPSINDTVYSALKAHEPTDDAEASHFIPKEDCCTRVTRPRGRIIAVAIAALALSNACSAVLGAYMGRRSMNLDRQCASYTAEYCKLHPYLWNFRSVCRQSTVADFQHEAPVLKEVDIKYDTQQFNGSFMQEAIYRKVGSPEVDAAWEALGVDCT